MNQDQDQSTGLSRLRAIDTDDKPYQAALCILMYSSAILIMGGQILESTPHMWGGTFFAAALILFHSFLNWD